MSTAIGVLVQAEPRQSSKRKEAFIWNDVIK
jgi:hypothetical protein